MGPYCTYCDHRCFVPVPMEAPAAAVAALGTTTILATCRRGQANDYAKTGWNWDLVSATIQAEHAAAQSHPEEEAVPSGTLSTTPHAAIYPVVLSDEHNAFRVLLAGKGNTHDEYILHTARFSISPYADHLNLAQVTLSTLSAFAGEGDTPAQRAPAYIALSADEMDALASAWGAWRAEAVKQLTAHAEHQRNTEDVPF